MKLNEVEKKNRLQNRLQGGVKTKKTPVFTEVF